MISANRPGLLAICLCIPTSGCSTTWTEIGHIDRESIETYFRGSAESHFSLIAGNTVKIQIRATADRPAYTVMLFGTDIGRQYIRGSEIVDSVSADNITQPDLNQVGGITRMTPSIDAERESFGTVTSIFGLFILLRLRRQNMSR